MIPLICLMVLNGCSSGKSHQRGEVHAEEKTRPKTEERILTFFAPLDDKSSGAIAYRRLAGIFDAPGSAEAASELSDLFRDRRFLLVEDNELNREKEFS